MPANTEPVACTLTPEALQGEAAHLLPGLVARAQDVTWLSEGVRLTFASETGLLAYIADVIERERTCCRFFHFRLDAAPSGVPVRLEITGPPGTRALLEALPAIEQAE